MYIHIYIYIYLFRERERERERESIGNGLLFVGLWHLGIRAGHGAPDAWNHMESRKCFSHQLSHGMIITIHQLFIMDHKLFNL